MLASRRSFDRMFNQLTDDLERRHNQRQRNARLLRRAVDHGVWPEALRGLEFPASVAVMDLASE